MSSTIDCQKCGHEHDAGDYPDHWQGGASNFDFECEKCGAEFNVWVEWSPGFYTAPVEKDHTP